LISVTADGIALILSALAMLLGAYATTRNAIRKAEYDRLSARVVELEKRLAESDKRATDNEHHALEYRQDVIKLGEQLEAERYESIRRLSLVAADGNDKISKVVIVLEKLAMDFEIKTGTKADVDLEALRRLTVISVTDRLGTIDVHATRKFDG
jgi:hypothetical protein